MNIFNKRKTLIENIAYMGIMAAINVIFVLMATLLPFLLFLLVFILPLTSTIVTIFCKKKYYPIYFVATIGLCMIVTLWNISDTFFYVIPSLISGFIFGIMIERKINPLWSIISATAVNIGITFATIPLINNLLNIDIVDTFLSVFSLSTFTYKSELVVSFIFFLSLVQQSLAYLVIKEELPKMGIDNQIQKPKDLIVKIASLSSFALCMAFVFIYPPVAFVLFFINLYFAIYQLYYLVESKNMLSIVLLVAALFILVFAFAILFQYMPAPCGIMLISLYGLFTTIIGFINNQLLKREQKDKIIDK